MNFKTTNEFLLGKETKPSLDENKLGRNLRFYRENVGFSLLVCKIYLLILKAMKKLKQYRMSVTW
jgi:ascorbate-specific PTS system EIIC-type component UlaA